MVTGNIEDESGIEFVGKVPADIIPASCSSDYEGTVTDSQSNSLNDYQLISTFLDIRCFCHLNLLNAKIRIVHEENTGAVILWLLSGSAVVLNVRAEFDYLNNRICINCFSYGFAEPQHSIRIPLDDCIHFHLHVYHKTYLFEVNGTEVLSLTHRLPFHYVEPKDVKRRDDRAYCGRKRRNRLLPY